METDTVLREELVKANVTLNGLPAKIVGLKCPFALVRTSHYEVEFSWPAVEYVIRTQHGAFRS